MCVFVCVCVYGWSVWFWDRGLLCSTITEADMTWNYWSSCLCLPSAEIILPASIAFQAGLAYMTPCLNKEDQHPNFHLFVLFLAFLGRVVRFFFERLSHIPLHPHAVCLIQFSWLLILYTFNLLFRCMLKHAMQVEHKYFSLLQQNSLNFFWK